MQLVSILQQIGEELHLAPDVVIDQPLHQLAYGLGPRLIVEHPEHAASLPGRHQRAVRHLEQHVIVSQIGQRRHIRSQTVDQLVQRADDVTALAEVETRQVLIQLLVELVGELSQPGNAPFAVATRLEAEYHAPECAVGQLVLIELTG